MAIFANLRNQKKDVKGEAAQDATQMTTVIVKLENINAGVCEIKAEMTSIKHDLRCLSDRLIVVEESAKNAHKRIETIEKTLM